MVICLPDGDGDGKRTGPMTVSGDGDGENFHAREWLWLSNNQWLVSPLPYGVRSRTGDKYRSNTSEHNLLLKDQHSPRRWPCAGPMRAAREGLLVGPPVNLAPKLIV
jgi:hypothetical protein